MLGDLANSIGRPNSEVSPTNVLRREGRQVCVYLLARVGSVFKLLLGEGRRHIGVATNVN